MTEWTNAPPTNDDRRSYKLLRCPAGGSIRGIIVNAEPVGAQLHYWKGRTVPCNKLDCDACKASHVPRWKGYLLIQSRASTRLAIVEYTERIHGDIAREHATNNGLRGSEIKIYRLGSKPNSPLYCEFDGKCSNLDLLPPEEDIQTMLERMWEVRQQPLWHQSTQSKQPEPSVNGHRLHHLDA